MKTNVSRRTFLRNVPAAAAVLAVPSTAEAAPTMEHPWVAARRLAKELAAALDAIRDIGDGEHVAVVHGADQVWFADRHQYDSLKRVSAEQAIAIEVWRDLLRRSTAQWEVYTSFRDRSPAAEAAYRNWQALYEQREEAVINLLRQLASAAGRAV